MRICSQKRDVQHPLVSIFTTLRHNKTDKSRRVRIFDHWYDNTYESASLFFITIQRWHRFPSRCKSKHHSKQYSSKPETPLKRTQYGLKTLWNQRTFNFRLWILITLNRIVYLSFPCRPVVYLLAIPLQVVLGDDRIWRITVIDYSPDPRKSLTHPLLDFGLGSATWLLLVHLHYRELH